MTETEVTYCEGWDPAARQEYGIITEAEAAVRDRDGLQYAVLLRESRRPVALIRVAWAAGYLGVWQFDDQARRTREFDFQVLGNPNRLHWYGFRGWLPRSPYDPEFFEKRPQLTLRIGLDGIADALSSSRGRGAGHSVSTRRLIPTNLRAISRPSFGDWEACVGRTLFDPASSPPALSPSARLATEPVSGPSADPLPETAQPGWTPPLPPLGPAPAADVQDTGQWATPADCSRFTGKLLATLKSAEARIFAEEPVEMPNAPAIFEPRARPELRFPDHDRAVQEDTEVAVKTRHGDMCRQVSRSYDKALAAYDRAIELDPEYTPAIAGRGDVNRLAGHHIEAIDDLSRALDLHPGLSAAYISRARAYYALGRYSEALHSYDRFEEIGFTGTGSGFSPVIDRSRRGDIYRRLGRLDEALADFDYALRVSPDDAIALAGRGDTLRLLGRHEEAVVDLTRAIELEPDLGEAYTSRGASYQALGRDEEARADLERKTSH
jgi:regulator of sirC expression with transglutaminase-like and TPR domain